MFGYWRWSHRDHNVWVLMCSQLLQTTFTLPIDGPGSLDLTLFVRSQDTAVDRSWLEELRTVVAEAGWPNGIVVAMYDAERDLRHRGLWSYKPWVYLHDKALQKERRRSAGAQRWVMFLEPSTIIDPTALQGLLAEYDAREKIYLGRKLIDAEHSIIHHYNTETPYPHLHSGFVLSGSLLRSLAKGLKTNPLPNEQQIEPVWEFAKWIHSEGVTITDRSDVFCLEKQSACASWARNLNLQNFSPAVPDDVLIAVKTVSHFHSTRIPIIHESWGSSSPAKVVYLSNEGYSDSQDYEILKGSVINLSPEFGDAVDPKKESTKSGSGHCAKMKAILQYLHKHESGKKWYVVADDDTLLNVPRLLQVLGLHDPTREIYLGERYGWGHTEEREGTNYMTTGAGMALSALALKRVVSCESCTCPSPSSPDDMMLGAWMFQMSIQMVHEEAFHQAEPHNYHPDVLRSAGQAISFHRYNVRVPATTPAAQVQAERKKSWRGWQRKYFHSMSPHAEL